MIRSFVCLGFICVFIFSVTVYSSSTVWPKKKKPPIEHGSATAETKVLIAGKESKFRDAVISELTNRLVKDSIHVRLINLSDLGSITPDEWSAILLVNKCIAWNYEGPVKKFFKSHPDSKNVVLFTTSGDPERCIPEKKPERKAKVDTYTSASEDSKITEAVDTLSSLLNGVLNRN